MPPPLPKFRLNAASSGSTRSLRSNRAVVFAICFGMLLTMCSAFARAQERDVHRTLTKAPSRVTHAPARQTDRFATQALFQTQTALAAPRRPQARVTPASAAFVESGEKADVSVVTATSRDLGPGPDFAAQLADDESHMIQFIEILQWTIVVLLIAVVAALALRKYGRVNAMLPPQNSVISHLATLPVKNHFQAHLLEVGSQRFLVTTDRSGVKTVNPVNSWDEFSSSVEASRAAAAA